MPFQHLPSGATMEPCRPCPTDEITCLRWQLIADETIDRAFAEAGVDELLAQALEQLETAVAESKDDE